jgi:acetolactate decarboxylase
VQAQSKPYRDLVAIAKEQHTWTHEDIEGTLVGIRSPGYIGAMNVSGYHWHFISADRQVGGHVLAAEVDRDRVDIDHIRTWEVALPEGEDFGRLDLTNDRSKDLETVEK